MVNDLTEGLQHAQVFRLDRRRIGKLLLQGREDFHALDRVDAEVGVERHLHFEHLDRIAGLLGDHLEEHL